MLIGRRSFLKALLSLPLLAYSFVRMPPALAMDPRIWPKEPWETEIYEFDCSEILGTGVSITNANAAMFDEEGTDVSSTMIEGSPSIDGAYVYVHVKAGEADNYYYLRLRLTLSSGEHAEDWLIIYVATKSPS